MRVSIIGIGGIGTHLAGHVARYLAYLPGEHVLTLVDGDTFDDDNAKRQVFTAIGMKARVVAEDLAARHPTLQVEAVTEWLSPETGDFIMLEGEIVLLCVDNHPTRLLAAQFAAGVRDISLISGGNELETGNVQVHLRRDGVDLTPPLTYDHPEIEKPEGKAPYQMSCEELAAAGAPQIIFANVMAAALMGNALWRLTTEGVEAFVSQTRGDEHFSIETAYTESAFDIRANMVQSRKRSLTQSTQSLTHTEGGNG